MKLIRFGEINHEKPGIELSNGKRIDVSIFGEDYGEDFFGSKGPERLSNWIIKNESECPEVSHDIRLGPPICRPSKIVCVGLNYAKHAKESGMQVPSEPVLFFKASSAIIGPNDEVIIPKDSKKTDWEVELSVVIGDKASYVKEKDAIKYVAGYVGVLWRWF